MGEIADDEIAQGQDAWIAHNTDECDDGCEYCQEEREEGEGE